MNFLRLFARNARPIVYATGAAGTTTTLYSLSLFGKSEPTSRREVGLMNQDDLIIREADMLYDAYLITNVYNLLKKYSSSESSELLWRLARCLCEMGKLEKDAKEKKRLFAEALGVVEKALKCEPEMGSFGAHKWYAIILNYAMSLEGSKAQLAKSLDVKAHLEKALGINSLDATTWHTLGIWHYSFADLSTTTRLAARLLFATPPTSTYEEALRHFERAEAVQPNFYSTNHYYLALCHEHLNHPEEALYHMKKAYTAPVTSLDDKETNHKASQYLKKKYKFTDETLYKILKDNP